MNWTTNLSSGAVLYSDEKQILQQMLKSLNVMKLDCVCVLGHPFVLLFFSHISSLCILYVWRDKSSSNQSDSTALAYTFQHWWSRNQDWVTIPVLFITFPETWIKRKALNCNLPNNKVIWDEGRGALRPLFWRAKCFSLK